MSAHCPCCGEAYPAGRTEPDGARELLWAAFLAGFEESGEGFNGEYVGEKYRGRDGVDAPAFIDRMRPEFDRWFENLT